MAGFWVLGEWRDLDGREHPEVEAGRPRERPEFFDVLRYHGRAVHEAVGRLVDAVIDHRAADVRRHVILITLLPRFGDLGANVDVIDAVQLPGVPQPIAPHLQLAIHLRREPITENAHVPSRPRVLHVAEHHPRVAGTFGRIELGVRPTDVEDSAVKTRVTRRGRLQTPRDTDGCLAWFGPGRCPTA